MLPTRLAGNRESIPLPASNVLMLERHFSFQELAEKWGLSVDFISKRFRDEPGVICTQKTPRRGRRGRGICRVPESIAMKIYGEMRL